MKILQKRTHIFLLICLFGCSYFTPHRTLLDRAEGFVEQQPDSAYMILSKIYIDNILCRNTKARFALLYSQTLDKICIDIQDDSLARLAVDYYVENGSNIEKTTAYYYLGRVYENAGDLEPCIENLTLAGEFAPEDSYDLKGLIYNALARNCANQLDYTKSIEYKEKAIIAHKAIGNKNNYATSLSNIANSYGLIKDYNNALLNERRSLDIYIELKDSAKIIQRLGNIAIWNMRNNVPLQKIKRNLFAGYSKYNISNKYPLNYWLLSEIYKKEGKIDSAIYYLKHEISKQDTTTFNMRASYYYKLSKIEVLKRDYRKAQKYDKQAHSFANLFYNVSLSKTTQELTEKYRNALYKASLIKAEQEKESFLYILGLSFFLFCGFLYILINRYRSRIKNIDRDLCTTQELLETLNNSKIIIEEQYNLMKEQNEADKDSIENEHNTATLENMNFLMMKFNDLIEKVPQYDKKPRKFIDEFITLMRSTEKIDSKILFYDIVNRQYNGVLDRIKERYALEQYEADLYSMICLRFSNSAMRILFDHTNDKTIYNYRSGLKTKLGISIDRGSLIALLNSRV